MRTALSLALALLFSAHLSAQPVVEETIELERDRPEAWAMKFYAGVTLLTATVPPSPRKPGSIGASFELITIPDLSEAQRRVGFNGIKEEDLDKLPLLGRGRVSLGLPAGLEATLAWVPPIEVGGVRANLIGGSLGRGFSLGAATDVWVRAIAQTGEVEGSFTCWDEVVGFPPGSAQNPFACERLSEDVYAVDYAGGEVGVARRFGFRGTRLHLALLAVRTETEFQVEALRSGFLDRTLLLNEGSVVAGTAGASWALPGGLSAGLELLYAPLEVRRMEGAPSENDPLFNLRILLAYDF